MEFDVFHEFKPQLALAISDSIPSVALQCHSKGLIKNTYSEICQLQLTNEVKAHRLLGAIEKCVATDPAHYRTFMDILDEELPDGCKKPLSEMEEALLSLMRERHGTCSDTGMTNESSIIDVPQPSGSSKTYYPYRRSSLKKRMSNNSIGKYDFSRTFSTDSGISIGSTDSISNENLGSYSHLNSISEESQPLEETPLPNNGKSEPCVTQKALSETRLESRRQMHHLNREIKQKEVINNCLKDELDQLRIKLGNAVVEKNEAQETLCEMENNLTKLQKEKDSIKRELVGKVEEVDGLEERLSAKEADIERLSAQVTDYKKQISDQIAEIEEKNLTITNLRAKIYELERENVEKVVEYRRSNSIELKAELKRKDTELNIKVAEMKAKEDEIKAKDAELKDYKSNERLCLYKLVFVLIVVLVLGLSIAVGVVYFEHRGSACGCHLRNSIVL